MPIEIEVLDVTLPDENSLRAMIYYQQDQPELYHGRKDLDAAYHRFAKRHRVEFVHAYDPQRAQAAIGRFRGSDFTSAQGYEGPGEGVGYRIIPRSFYGPGRTFTDRARDVARGRRVDDVHRRERAEGVHVPLHAGRAAAGAVSRDRGAGRSSPRQSRAGQASAHVRDACARAGTRAGDRHLVRRAVALRPLTRRQRARGRQAVLVLQRRTPADRRDHHRLAGDRLAHGRLGGVQA